MEQRHILLPCLILKPRQLPMPKGLRTQDLQTENELLKKRLALLEKSNAEISI